MKPLRFWCLLTVFLVISVLIFLTLLAFPFIFGGPKSVFESFGIDFKPTGNEDWKDVHWGYGILAKLKKLLPKNWGKKYRECDGNLQSPVDLDSNNVLNNSLLSSIQYSLYETRPKNDLWNVTNNGHTVQFSADFKDPPYISEGGLIEGRYYFRQLHFHWGTNDSLGSEHTLNGKQFPLEVHLVHTRNPEDKTPYKIAVLGVFFEINSSKEENTNSRMAKLFETLGSVRNPGIVKQIRLLGFTLKNLIPDGDRYFRYYGSLTTPPCSQFLQWTVLETPLKLSSDRLAGFRNLLSSSQHSEDKSSDVDSEDGDKFLQENYRPVQTAKGRVINYFAG